MILMSLVIVMRFVPYSNTVISLTRFHTMAGCNTQIPPCLQLEAARKTASSAVVQRMHMIKTAAVVLLLYVHLKN